MVMLESFNLRTQEFFKRINVSENNGYILTCRNSEGKIVEIPITTYESVLKKSKNYSYVDIKDKYGNLCWKMYPTFLACI